MLVNVVVNSLLPRLSTGGAILSRARMCAGRKKKIFCCGPFILLDIYPLKQCTCSGHPMVSHAVLMAKTDVDTSVVLKAYLSICTHDETKTPSPPKVLGQQGLFSPPLCSEQKKRSDFQLLFAGLCLKTKTKKNTERISCRTTQDVECSKVLEHKCFLVLIKK